MLGHTFQGSNSVIYVFFPFSGCLLSKERICSSWSKFFPLRVNPSLEGQCKQTGSHKSCCPLVKIAEKHGGVPIQVSKKEYCPMMSILYHDHKYIAPAYNSGLYNFCLSIVRLYVHSLLSSNQLLQLCTAHTVFSVLFTLQLYTVMPEVCRWLTNEKQRKIDICLTDQ